MPYDPDDLAERVATICRTEPGIVSAYLFGSVAGGRAHRESDLDLGILLAWDRYPTPRARFEARLTLAAMLAHALHRDDIDLVVLNEAPPHLARAIVSAGRPLWIGDAEADRAFVRTTMLRAADLEPFLRRTRRLKLAALARPAAHER